MVNPNDRIRRQLLRHFYERNANATSRFGKRGSAAKISDVKRDIKSVYGLSQREVVSNLTYLIDRGWVNVIDVEKTIQVSGGTVPSTVTWYEISADGIDKLEGESEFQSVDRYPGINIMAMGSNTITLGDGNIVNVRHEDLHGALSELKEAVLDHSSLSDTQKLDVAVDIESLKDQLAKGEPDRAIIANLWRPIQVAAVAAGLVDHVAKITTLFSDLMVS